MYVHAFECLTKPTRLEPCKGQSDLPTQYVHQVAHYAVEAHL